MCPAQMFAFDNIASMQTLIAVGVTAELDHKGESLLMAWQALLSYYSNTGNNLE